MTMFTITQGCAERERLAIAALWWRGMGRRVLPFATMRAGVAWARGALRPQAALIARDGAGRVIGLAGLRDGQGGLIRWQQPLAPVLGRLAGSTGRAGLMLWRAGPATADLVLDGLAVHPRAQGRGVARALLRAALAEAEARGRPGLTVEVAEGDRPALALYRSEGFAPVSRRRAGHSRALILRLPVATGQPITASC